MEHVNQTLFLLINAAPSHSSIHYLAIIIAKLLIVIIPVTIVFFWLYGSGEKRNEQRVLAVKLLFAVIIGLLLSDGFGDLFPYQRPFVFGIGTNFLPHEPTLSFPSNHGTAIFTFAFGIMLWYQLRVGIIMFIIGLAIAWSRIYLGVHWPLDMIGSLLVGGVSILLTQLIWNLWGQKIMKIIIIVYHNLLKKLNKSNL